MSRRMRIFLALLGLALLAISITALSFAFAPSGVIHEATRIAPTLFTLPAGGVP